MKTIIAVMLLVCMAVAVSADVPMDVPRDHWAYDAVNTLAEKGYVLGYPDGSFLGDRTLTRYEFATVLKRVLDTLETKIGDMDANTSAPAASGVSQSDLDSVKALVDEFKVELAVIGTRVDKLEATVEELQSTVKNMHATLYHEEGALESTRKNVSKLKKIKVGGYVQARWTPSQDKLDGGTEVSEFQTRRARVKFTGTPTDKAKVVCQLDLAKNKVDVKETYIQYSFAGSPTLGPAVKIGQQTWPFGYDVVESSSRRETPERALVFQRLFPGEYDRGVYVTNPFGDNVMAGIGLFEGTGDKDIYDPGTVDTKITPDGDKDQYKDVVANVQWANADWALGASAYYGKGFITLDGAKAATLQEELNKYRWGVDFRYYWNNLTFKCEYVRGKGVENARDDQGYNLTDWIDGWYGQLNFNFTPRDAFVTRYSRLSFDPTRGTNYGHRNALELGWIHWLDDKTTFKVFWQKNEEEFNSFDNDIWTTELMTKF